MKKGGNKMYNLVKDEYDSNIDDIIASVNKMINKTPSKIKKGKLFVIDGTDGSGKQTQFKKLQERLDKENIEYKTVSFPNYDSPSSSLVKMYLSGEFGKNAKEILTILSITENTLKFHNKNIYNKLGVSSRKQLLRYATLMKHQK